MRKGFRSFKFSVFWVFILSTALAAKQDEDSKDSLPKIILIDSKVCLELLPKELSLKLEKIETESPTDCQKDFRQDPRPFHGQLTLSSFLTHLRQEQKVYLIHLNPFRADGQQDFENFKGIHQKLNEEVFSAVMMPMAGLIPNLIDLKIDSWRSPVFLASGQRGAGSLNETQFMWPHSLLAKNRSDSFLIVGTYLPLDTELVIENSELFHKEKIDLFLSENESFSQFSGSSRGTAEAAAKAINYCHKTTESLLSCLKKKITTIPATSGRQLPTL